MSEPYPYLQFHSARHDHEIVRMLELTRDLIGPFDIAEADSVSSSFGDTLTRLLPRLHGRPPQIRRGSPPRTATVLHLIVTQHIGTADVLARRIRRDHHWSFLIFMIDPHSGEVSLAHIEWWPAHIARARRTLARVIAHSKDL